MLRKLIYSFALGVLPLPVMAQDNQCGEDGPRIIQAIYPEAKPLSDGTYGLDGRTISVPGANDTGGDPHGMLCRAWPAYPDRLLVGVPLMRDDVPAEAGFDALGDLDLLVLKPGSLEIEARLRLEDFIQEDAIYLSGMWFDTAAYRLIGDRTAFGLRREMEGSSRPNPFGITGLWLFDVDGGTIRPVMEGLEVQNSGGEWDTNCAGEFTMAERVLDIAPTQSNGASDVVVRTTLTTTVNTPSGSECNSVDTTTEVEPVTLRYDGQLYPVPDDLMDMYVKN